MRCLTLAAEMHRVGWDVAFAVSPETGETVPVLPKSGFRVIYLEDAADPDDCVAAAGPDWDVVLVDQYALGPGYETELRRIASAVAIIDDLMRPHDCDLLIDTTHGRIKTDYVGLVPDDAVFACGSEYALLRPDFSDLRAESLARRDGRAAERLLISLGFTDVGAITGSALQKILPVFPGRIDVVLGRNAPSHPDVDAIMREVSRVKLHVDSAEIAYLMKDADLAIGAGGTTSWERCCLGLPTLLFTLADNQRDNAAMLSAAGAVRRVDLETLADSVRTLVADHDVRQTMTEASASICDGAGASRVRTLLEELVG